MSKERLLSGYDAHPDLHILDNDEDAHSVPKCFVPQRVILSILVFIGLMIVYLLRVTLSVAILPISEEQKWDPSVKGIALSSFFWGYVCTQMVGAILSKKFGGKPLFGFGVLGASICTAVLPLTVHSYNMFIACRILTGLFEGVSYPSVQFLISKWIPDKEHSRAVTFMWSGAHLGSIIAMLCSPIIIGWAGWPSIFYISSAVGLAWVLVWFYVAASTPKESRFITHHELRTIFLGISSDEVEKKTPWKKMFKSVPVWTIIINNFCINWGFYTLLTWMPTYMKDNLDFNLQNAGFLSVLPYVALFCMTNAAGRTSDFILSKGVNRTFVRKAFFSAGTIIPALFLALLCRDPTPQQAVAFLICAVGTAGLGPAALGPNTLDVVGENSGILIGVSNMVGNIPGIVAVAATGFILEHTNNSWCVVFLIASGLYLFGCILWNLFATGKQVV